MPCQRPSHVEAGVARLVWLCAMLVLIVPGARGAWWKEHVTGRGKLQAQPTTSTANRTPQSCLAPPPSFLPAALDTERGVVQHVLVDFLSVRPASLAGVYMPMGAMTAAAWNAFAVFHPEAKPIFDTGIPRAAAALQTLRNRNIAIAYAATRVAEAMTPATTTFVTNMMAGLGLNISERCTSDMSNPTCVGNKVGVATLDWMDSKGANFRGCSNRNVRCNTLFAENEVSGYSRKIRRTGNTVYELKNIFSWQPLLETDGVGNYYAQQYSVGYLAEWDPVVLPKSYIRNRQVQYKKPSMKKYKEQADEVLRASAMLATNETMKMYAEYGNSGNPFNGPLRFLPGKFSWSQTRMMAYFLVNVLAMDTNSMLQKEKRRLDTVRPQSAIRYIYGDKKVTAYAGPDKGTQQIAGNEWLQYLATAPEPEFPSGLTCACAVSSYWIEEFTGSKAYGLTWSTPKGCSAREPNVTPKTNFSATLVTTDDLREMCKNARVWAGQHFVDAVVQGIELCKEGPKMGLKWVKTLLPNLGNY